MTNPEQSGDIEEIIGYFFSSPDILQRAMRRKAFCQEAGFSDDSHMDALATLGDAVIELHVLTRLVQSGESDKGEISVRKMDLVNMSALRQIAERNRLSGYISWGRGERQNHIWTSGRVLAECLEALIGAVFLDGGLVHAGKVMEKLGFFPAVTDLST